MHGTHRWTNQCTPHIFPHMQKQDGLVTTEGKNHRKGLIQHLQRCRSPLPAMLKCEAHSLRLRHRRQAMGHTSISMLADAKSGDQAFALSKTVWRSQSLYGGSFKHPRPQAPARSCNMGVRPKQVMPQAQHCWGTYQAEQPGWNK